MSGRFDIELEAGASYDLDLTYTDQAGQPVPLAGWSARCEVREDYESDPVLVLSSAPGGGITFGPGTGQVALAFSPAATLAVPTGAGLPATLPRTKQYLYDVLLTSPEGRGVRLVYGYVQVSAAVTRPAS